ncbi:MAG: ABC transporter permease, partial [Cytophagaceae bacterium]|nr:ABC transporter permease [Gemmatimonadaceae bacterium]
MRPLVLSGMASLGNDLAFAVRSLKRSPGFVILVVLSLGIALGVTTTMFGLVDTALNPVVPMREVDRLVVFANNGDGVTRDASWHVKFDAARQAPMFAATAVTTDRYAFLRLGNHTDSRRVTSVSPQFFDLTGLVPFLGRNFAADGSDGVAGSSAMVSFDLWRKALGGRTDLRGASVTVDDRSYEVVGVLPPYLPMILAAAVYLPMPASVAAVGDSSARANFIARLSPGASWGGAQATLRTMADPVLTARLGTGRRPFRYVVRPLADGRPDGMTDLQQILLAAGVLVLVIACGNMANLVLARGLVREREFALRFALGAGRGSVVRQVLIEALLCALAGALVGVLVAQGAFGLLTYHISRDVPGLGAMAVSLNWRIFGFTLGLATVTTLAFAIVPAWRTSRVDLTNALKAGAGTTTGRNRSRFSVLVVVEVTLTMTLMLGASLLMKAVREMRSTEFGFNPRGLVDVSVYLWRRPVGEGQLSADSLVRVLREQVLALPGVLGASAHGTGATQGAGVTSILPGGGAHWLYRTGYTAVGPDYPRTMGLAITEGRDFVEGDATGRGAVILNAAAARALFRGEPAVGQLVKLGEHGTNAPSVPVVGVSRDVFPPSTVMPVESAEPDLLVVPPPGLARLVHLRVRVSEARRAETEAEVESLVQATMPPQASVAVTRPMEEFNEAILAREFVGRLFVLFALIGCGLAAVGLYCLLAFVVAQRRREFAVRIALGATRRQVTRIV